MVEKESAVAGDRVLLFGNKAVNEPRGKQRYGVAAAKVVPDPVMDAAFIFPSGAME